MIRTDAAPASDTRGTAQSWVLRFTRTERLAHWVQALSFLVLLATGFLVSINVLEAAIGHRALWREVHLWAAFVFVFGPSLVALAGNRAAVGRTVREVDEWTRDDVDWLAHPAVDPGYATPPQDRLNAGQKLNAIFTLYSTFAFGITGLILWQNRRFPFTVVQQANTIHTLLAYIAFAVFLGHVYLATVYPATRHALHGIIFGTVRRDWAAHHHPLWHPTLSGEPAISVAGAVRAVVLLVVAAIVTLLLVRFGFEWLGANTTDPVTSAVYRVSRLPGTMAGATGVHVFDLAALFWAGFVAACWAALAARTGS